MAQAKRTQPTVNLEPLIRQARTELETHGFFKLSLLKPKTAREAVVSELSRAGFELTKSVVRVPLSQQLSAALQHGGVVPLSSLAASLPGATPAERKVTVAALIATGEARKVLRGSAEVLVGRTAKIVLGAELKELERVLNALVKSVGKAAKQPATGLLKSDLEEALHGVSTLGLHPSGALPPRAPAPEPDQRKHHGARAEDQLFVELLRAVAAVQDPTTRLAFVPHVVSRLEASMDATAAQDLLLKAAGKELLELRPEGGIARLTETELAVCPPGPHGTRLSWARALGRGDA